MENGLVTQHKFTVQDQAAHRNSSQVHANKTDKRTTENINTEVARKSIWQSVNIFSKIKKFSKAKIKHTDSVEEEIKTSNRNRSGIQRCKSNDMVDRSHSEGNDLNEDQSNDSTSTESKSSFFGKMNLESLLKIFVDLHKKKQSSQNCQNNRQTPSEGIVRANFSQKSVSSNGEELNPFQTIHMSFNNLEDNGVPTIQSEQLQNPVNTPSLINTTNTFGTDILSISEKSDLVTDTDSTLSLLNNVSIKLKSYLMSDTRSNDPSAPKGISILEEISNFEETVTATSLPDIVNNQVNEPKDSKLDLLTENAISAESHQNRELLSNEETDKTLAYTIVETDIKRMIKELLQESKDLKNSIMATGVEEEPTSTFTQLSKDFDSFLICRGLCNDLINVACSKQVYSLKTRKHLNVTFKRDSEQEIESILTTLLENVLMRKSSTPQLCINFCLVQTNSRNKTKKHVLDPSLNKFRESNVYILTKKLYQVEGSFKKVALPPKVTVHNLSTSKRIKFLTTENSLMSRIRRSAALLMALYDEMRDYSYYSCTPNILCDLYESMIKQGLISVTNMRQRRPVANVAPQESILTNPENENNIQESSITPVSTLAFNCANNPCSSSCGNPSNVSDLILSDSNDSLSAESEDEDKKSSPILPNLRYTYQSKEEINSPEEMKKIDDNVTQNGNCKDVDMKETNSRSDESVSVHYEHVTINESEAFIKD